MRKDIESHRSTDCSEQLMDCSNDDCKQQIKRKNFRNHVNNECESRIVDCKFRMYGCQIHDIKASELNKHLQEYQMEHLSLKFDFITTQV